MSTLDRPRTTGCLDENRLVAWAEGSMPADERGLVAAHLDSCAACRSILAAVADPRQTMGPEQRPDARGDTSPRATWQVEATTYRVVGELARGGLGQILEAEDDNFGRRVALKRPLGWSDAIRDRFARETRVTARLQHPAIVPVYAIGASPNGKPFFAMKLVDGARSLAELLAACERFADRLALLPNLIAVADAIAYAHTQSVVHRDLKPSNVLVGPFGETVVIDWGVAKSSSAPEPFEPTPPEAPVGLTQGGDVLGTPSYMPPEQARGEAVDARADVYALGAMLYQLLSGRPPYVGESSAEVLRQVLAGPPPALPRGVPVDLAAVATKAMARDPSARYTSAADLVGDLKRFANGQLVGAYRYSRFALLGRWLWRHRLPVGLTLAFLAAIVVTVTVAFHRVVANRNHLIVERARAFLGRDPTAAVAALKAYPDDGTEWDAVHAIAVQARAQGVALHVFRGDQFDLRGDATIFSADGRLLAVPSNVSGTLELRELASGAVHARTRVAQPSSAIFVGQDVVVMDTRALHVWRPYAQDLLTVVPMPPDTQLWSYGALGRGPGLAAGGARGQILLWSSPDATPRVLQEYDAPVIMIRADATGKYIVTADGARQTRVTDVTTGTSRSVGRPGEPVDHIAPCDRGRRILFTSPKALRAIDIGTGAEQEPPEVHPPFGTAACSSDRDVLVFVQSDTSTVTVWRPGTAPRDMGEHPGASFTALSPDGTLAVTTDYRGELDIWSTELPGDAAIIRGPDGTPHPYFSPDGRFIVAAQPGVERVYPAPVPPRLLDTDELMNECASSDDRRHIVCAASGYNVTYFEVATGHGRKLTQHADAILDLEISHDGRRVVSVGRDGTIHIVDVETGHDVAIAVGAPVQLGAFAPDDGSVLTLIGGAVVRWSLDGKQLDVIRAPGPLVAFALKDGSLLGGYGDLAARSIQPWRYDLTTRLGRDLGTRVGLFRFALDGNGFATATDGGCIEVWRGHDAQQLCGQHGAITAATLSLANNRFVSTSDDGSTRIWDLTDGSSRALAVPGKPSWLALTKDGTRLAVVSGYDVTIWDVSTARMVDSVHELAAVSWISWIDDTTLATHTRPAVHLWSIRPLAVGATPADERRWFEQLTTATLDADGVPWTQ